MKGDVQIKAGGDIVSGDKTEQPVVEEVKEGQDNTMSIPGIIQLIVDAIKSIRSVIP